MTSHRAPETTRIFRTQAWGNAWLDVWGEDKRLTLFDLGGRRNPREMLYSVKSHIKKILPYHSLHLVGVSGDAVSTPRAEYNDLSELMSASGTIERFLQEVEKLSWSQFRFSDVIAQSPLTIELQNTLRIKGLHTFMPNAELAYYVKALDYASYLEGLGANTRLAYFNRRERLGQIGKIEFTRYSTDKAFEFFLLLNQFHWVRWGQACYSKESQCFLKNFMERLVEDKGVPVMEAMQVNGEIVSVLFDMELDGCRYNFQSGYLENKFPKIALGAIHMGFGIQSAIEQGLIYDFMAGEGKHSNYKARIATDHELLESIILERGVVKYMRKLKNLRKLKKPLHPFSPTHSEG
jgi:Acetyltransferase (GNAT) domain